MDKSIKKMSIKELDEYIEKLPYAWMKALRSQKIKKTRPDYISKHLREKE